MSIVIRTLVIGLLVFAGACGDNPSLEDVCGDCPDGTIKESCEVAYEECDQLPLQRVRDTCFAVLGSPCDSGSQ